MSSLPLQVVDCQVPTLAAECFNFNKKWARKTLHCSAACLPFFLEPAIPYHHPTIVFLRRKSGGTKSPPIVNLLDLKVASQWKNKGNSPHVCNIHLEKRDSLSPFLPRVSFAVRRKTTFVPQFRFMYYSSKIRGQTVPLVTVLSSHACWLLALLSLFLLTKIADSTLTKRKIINQYLWSIKPSWATWIDCVSSLFNIEACKFDHYQIIYQSTCG